MPNTNGLVSISFRSKSVEEIAREAQKAGLCAIEWGGDVHVPHGDVKAAEHAAAVSAKYNLRILHYGSYYKIGYSDPELFSAVLKSAKILGAPIIRVWAGEGIHPDTVSESDYQRIVEDAKRICDMAGDILIATECHNDTLTENYKSALQFFKDVNRKNLRTLWQPNQNHGFEYDLEAIDALKPYIVGVHVFNWEGSKPEKYPLAMGAEKWAQYMKKLPETELGYMLEFMPDDNIESLTDESKTLATFTKELSE